MKFTNRNDEQHKPEHKPMDVPCMDCGATVTITSFTIGIALEVNKLCAAKGWSPLKKSEITRCDECRVQFEIQRQRKSEKASQLLRELRNAILAGRTSAFLHQTPKWFRDEYEQDIALELNSVGKLSTRKPDGKISIG